MRHALVAGGLGVVAVLTALDFGGAPREVIVAAVVLVAPGLALAPGRPVALVLAVGVSVTTLVVTALLVVGIYSPGLALALLAVVCLAPLLRPPAHDVDVRFHV
jgi:hypothetical protein